jgi:hypothetical protein
MPQQKSSVRPYYIFTAVVLGCGAVASVFAESWGSLAVFTILCAMAVWVAARVEGPSRAGDAPATGQDGGRLRPSERRRQRKSRG